MKELYLIYLKGKLIDFFLSNIFELLILEEIEANDLNQKLSKSGSLNLYTDFLTPFDKISPMGRH